MSNQPTLNPDALMGRVAGIIDSECELYGATVDGDPGEKLYGEGTDLPIRTAEKVMELIHPHLAVAQPEVNSVEELDALPQETVIRSVIFGVVRERMDSGWLATGADEFESTNEIAGRDHVVLHRPAVNDA